MDREDVLPHHTVVVRGDRIVAVHPAARVEIPAAARRIDGAGKWLMPGLADMHVHTWSEHDLTLFVAAGVTTVRNMFGSDQHLAWRGELARGARFGPTLVTASPIIDGDPPVWPGSIALGDPADADRIVGELAAKGYDFLKPYSRLSLPAYDALVAAGKKHGLPLGGHVPGAAGLRHALASGQRTIEHLDGWLPALVPEAARPPAGAAPPELRELLPLVDESRIPDLVKATIAAGTWNCPTLVVLDRMAALEDVEAARKRARWLPYVAPAFVAQWNPKSDFRLRTKTAEDFAAMRKANAVRGRIAAALISLGAPVLVGTDAGNPFVIPGESLHDELELLVGAGIDRIAPGLQRRSPADRWSTLQDAARMVRARVLRAATAGAADFLGQRGTLGVVAPGARADLLLLDEDPLARPLPLVPAAVILRGAYHPRADLEQRLAAVARAHAAPPSPRWEGVPPLAPEGTDVQLTRYDLVQNGKTIAEERLATGTIPGGRAIVAQLAGDFGGGRVELQYRIAPAAASVSQKTVTGSLSLDARLDRGALVATGTDPRGAPLSLSEPVPAGTFLAGPGIGGSFPLAALVAPMKIGERRTFSSAELATFPRPSIQRMTHDVERKPDAAGLRVFAITSRPPSGFGFDSELVLDPAGGVVRHTFGPPLDFAYQRR
jgi:imidazolonepropionase-like amidohydrolase